MIIIILKYRSRLNRLGMGQSTSHKRPGDSSAAGWGAHFSSEAQSVPLHIRVWYVNNHCASLTIYTKSECIRGILLDLLHVLAPACLSPSSNRTPPFTCFLCSTLSSWALLDSLIHQAHPSPGAVAYAVLGA